MLPTDDRRLFFLLDRAAHAFRERFDAHCRAQIGVSAAQLGALMHLARNPGTRAKDLAAAIGVQAAAVTGLVDRMEAGGFVRRTDDPADARVWRLEVTDRGRAAVAAARPVIAAANRHLAARFTEEELAVAARFLRAVRELSPEMFEAEGVPS